MKKVFLSLSLLLLLVSCNNINIPSSSNSSNHISSSESISNKPSESTTQSNSTSLSSSQSTNATVPSSSVTIPSDDKQLKLSKYATHPLSEPDINKQLHTFNPMGNLKDVWNHYQGDNVLVAVIDSGFDYNHPEFKYADGTSKVSDKSAYIYTSNNTAKVEGGKNKVAITDGDSHGTMCAGLLGASANGIGITGIAPNVDLMLIKIDKHALSMAEAFRYAADNGAKVISTSLGAYPNINGETSGDIHFPAGMDISKVFNDSINYAYNKGVSIVAATGNSKTTTLSYPAGCNNVIGAGGLRANSQTQIWDNGYEGSNYNGTLTYVDVFAPSDGIYAPGYDASLNRSTYWSDAKGTSFAAPLIAGAIALYYQKYPTHNNKDVEKALENACVNISSFNSNKNMGLGRLDVNKFLNISEDVIKENIVSSTTINQKATRLTIVDEEGWNLRTLHLYGLEFEKGYGYYELERFFENYYGSKIATSSYLLEGTNKGYAYTDENYVGDYYLCIGNKDDGIPTEYEYIFPWWVKEFSYQIVNNMNWLPEGGNKITFLNGYGKDVKAYFWYDSSTSFDVTQVVGESYETSFKAVLVKLNLSNSTNEEKVSIYDYFEVPTDKSWYIDKNYKTLYHRTLLNEDSLIYGK